MASCSRQVYNFVSCEVHASILVQQVCLSTSLGALDRLSLACLSTPVSIADQVIYIAGWRMLSVCLTAASSCYYSLGGLCGRRCHHRRRQQPGKRGSLWRTRLSETFSCHFDFTGLAHSPFFFRMPLCSFALKLGEEALDTLGRFGSRFHFLAVARQEVLGALTSEPREELSIPVSNSTREHASHTSSFSRMAAHWFALKPCEEHLGTGELLGVPSLSSQSPRGR